MHTSGVAPLKAGKFRTMEVSESKVEKSDTESSTKESTEPTEEVDDDRVPPP